MKSSVPIAVSTGTLYPLSTLASIERLKELNIQDVELTLQQNEFSLTFERKLSMPILPELSALVQSSALVVHVDEHRAFWLQFVGARTIVDLLC
jgi:hypothetical protein